MRLKLISALIFFGFTINSTFVKAQTATITEESRTFTTYPFDDPNPVPILTSNPKIYPYHRFEGYSHQSKPQVWKVVTLENDFIQVFVLPEVGGKIWGAIDKTTGKEFIYRNEVMKFRNIAMRGPWTSGGIEFNFGIIGHHPSTATPVDYLIQENEDGSVSCIVGNIDLPSRTHWRVNITLSPDKSHFMTKALWYNPTPLTQSYYNWMTAAAFARDDLEFFTPGNQYLEHSGEANPWPMDALGHNLAKYAENNFGGSKSYHVVGEYNDFFGGYFHRDRFGFGHWSTYEEMPGQKLWLWALSRSGGIWEDLLTDTDGQYIEFQAGRLFDQYSPGRHQNPITQVPFGSYTTDYWTELWFPFNEIGGLTEVSPLGAMHVSREGNQVTVGINALADVNGNLTVNATGKEILRKPIALAAAQIHKETVNIDEGSPFEVRVEGMDLDFKSERSHNQLSRPFEYPELPPVKPSTEAYRQGLEYLQYREYAKAQISLEQCLSEDPSHLEARVALAELLFRNAAYQEALEQVNVALGIDTYRPESNYVAGNVYRALGDYSNAMESFGWAARSMEFRSAAYAQMSELALGNGALDQARDLAEKALAFNSYNIPALQVKAVVARKSADANSALMALNRLLSIDPLNHLGHYEMSDHHTGYPLEDFFRSEFADQTYIEMALTYFNMGQVQEAKEILSDTDHVVAKIWMAYLDRFNGSASVDWLNQVKEASIEFVFPYRRETVSVLEWAESIDNHWKFKYYLGLIYWEKNNLAEAARLLNLYRSNPDEAVFYLTRADLLEKYDHTDPLQDLQKAMALAPDDWRVWNSMIDYYSSHGRYQEELETAEEAGKKWPQNYNLGLSYAQALLNHHSYAKCISHLKKLDILPFEGAGASRIIYERAYLGEALRVMERGQYNKAVRLLEEAKSWPEHLGIGKPFAPEQRQIDFLQAMCYRELGQVSNLEVARNALEQYTMDHFNSGRPANILGLLSMRSSGNQAKAESIVNKLETMDNLSSKWVVAQYRQDSNAIVELSPQLKEADPFGYQLLNQMIQLYGR